MVGLLLLVAEVVLILVGLVAYKLLLQILVEIAVFTYAAIMMKTWGQVCMWKTCQSKQNGILGIGFLFFCLV